MACFLVKSRGLFSADRRGGNRWLGEILRKSQRFDDFRLFRVIVAKSSLRIDNPWSYKDHQILFDFLISIRSEEAACKGHISKKGTLS